MKCYGKIVSLHFIISASTQILTIFESLVSEGFTCICGVISVVSQDLLEFSLSVYKRSKTT